VNTVILGANGKLGRILGFWAAKTGVSWITQSRNGSSDLLWSGNFDDPACDDVLQSGATLINMIGATSGDPDTLHHMNVSFVENLLLRAAKNNVAHVVLASSAAVYGGKGSGTFHEESSKNAAAPYGTSKIAMEAVAETCVRIPNTPKITILRIGNVAGADALIDAACRHSEAETPMPLHRFQDGSAPIRSYIGPQDLFRAIRDLSKSTDDPLRVFNVAHPQPVSLSDLATAYRSHLFPSLKWIDAPAPDEALREVVLDTARLTSHTNFMQHDNPADYLAAQAAMVINEGKS